MSGNAICYICGGRVFKGECDCREEPRPVYESEADPILTDERDEMDSPDKLRVLADWLDLKDKQHGRIDEDEVQQDLRKIASEIRALREQLRVARRSRDVLRISDRRLRDAIAALTADEWGQLLIGAENLLRGAERDLEEGETLDFSRRRVKAFRALAKEAEEPRP